MKNKDVLLSIEKLNRTFLTSKGEINALVDIEFGVKENEFLCIIGPSGCGKSTLLYIIGGIDKPTKGIIQLKDSKIEGPLPEIGVIFQRYAAFPWMTVEQNIEYGPRIAGVKKEERCKIVQKYLKLVGLQGYGHLFPKELSGGMSKRVDIARAYANDPTVLLMDEPFGALDDFTKKRMQEEILKIWTQENKTVIFVTHDLEEAAFLADRIIIMQKEPNKIKQTVTVNFSRPRTASLRNNKDFVEFKEYLRKVLGE